MDANQLVQLLNRGRKLQQENKLQPAKAIYQQVLQHYPNNADVHHLIGILFNQLKQPDVGIQHLTKAIALNPYFSQAHHNLGIIYKEKGEIDKAISSYQQALMLNPSYFKVIHKLGSAYGDLSKLDLARTHFEKALTINPSYAEGWQDYGIFFTKIHQITQAKKCLEKALELDSELVTAHIALGNIFAESAHYEKSIQHYKKALKIEPNNADAYTKLQRINDEICDWHNVPQRQKKLLEITRNQIASGEKISVDPFAALAYNWKPQDLAAVARNYSENIELQVKSLRTKLNFQFDRNKKSRLKIGYISCGFNNHPISHLAYNLFALHNRDQFEIFAFSLTKNAEDEYQKHMAATADHFIDLFSSSDAEAAQTIYNNNIDIFIDLDGYIRRSRTVISAMCPAPIQIAYLGFPGTSGANFFGYMLVDTTVVTPAAALSYTEKLVYLPNSYQINNNQQPIADMRLTRSQYGLPENGFIYCCFNNPYKIEPKIFSTWMEILSKTPNAVLWLLSYSTLSQANLRAEAKKMGIDPQRLIFSQREEKTLHLARNSLADLFLDTLYVNAHTTASDALWAGVPVLTCPGINFVSRVGASLLKAIDLPELIMPNLDAYRDTAIYFYHNRDELKKIRKKLAKNRLSQPLFDTKRFVKNLEKAYMKMWEIYSQGEAPREIKMDEKF